jgi:TonB family protein
MRAFPLYSILASLLLAAYGEPAYGQIPANPRHYYSRISPSNAPLKTEEAIYSPRPHYPIKARQRHQTGNGLFAIHIRADGRVDDVTTLNSTGHSELDQGAIESFREWHFQPRSIRVVRVPIRYIIGPEPKHVIPLPMKNLGDGADITIGYDPG